jgi:hypothetical protein
MAKKAKKAKTLKKVVKKKAAKVKKATKGKVSRKKPAAKKAAAPVSRTLLPPYKCQRTLDDSVCLRFRYNPTNGQYDLGGEEVPSSTCEYFM